MPINTAKNCFLGKEGLRKLNCAQSVIIAFKEKYLIDENTVESFKQYGGGKAPEGMCGAYYAAKVALEKRKPEKIKDFENYFTNLAGSTKCHQIREGKKFSCLDCVVASSEYLNNEK